ncbi:hypothetical protein CJ178_13155 [Rhodococcus sp. ACPA4]|uniref:hypothetical protein n=1 Tax=Rhodococcus sp. ACPA4 TaxID=2028571 RepID=UPI000BB0D507|nr:hypothetical protein [Rhodococcus sp. ACPA4]PBC42410.1 hypothetical protein CJ178_13155 [Rhodococcus sp. ACPA4]
MASEILFFSIIALISIRVIGLYRRGQLEYGMVSGLGAWMYLICLWIPANLQSSGQLDSKIERAGIIGLPTSMEIESLTLRWSLEVALIACAELIVVLFLRVKPLPKSTISDSTWKYVSFFLVVVGVVATIIFPADLNSRGAEGQGIFVLLRTSLVCGLSIIAFFNGFGKKSIRLLLVIGGAFLVFENVRSPLLVILISLLVGFISRGEIYRRKNLFYLSVLVIVGIFVAAFMSEMRANLTRSEGYSTVQLIEEMSANPLVVPFQSGIDTLDGYRFSKAISNSEPARPLDLLSPVTNFIPRAIWQDKPRSISVEVSTKYLGYKSSGQFLSPVGFLTLATGSYAMALTLFFLFMVGMAILVLRYRKQFWLSIILVVLFRFLLGGSAFDVYYGILLTLIICSGIAVVKFCGKKDMVATNPNFDSAPVEYVRGRSG